MEGILIKTKGSVRMGNAQENKGEEENGKRTEVERV